MKLLAVCESPPSTHSREGNGSTLIAANLISRLARDVELELVYFVDRGIDPDPAVVGRSAHVSPLAVRGRAASIAALPLTRLPRASWQRATSTASSKLRELDAWADVVWFHGLHTFGLLSAVSSPLLVHEVDPWSDHWRQRAKIQRRPIMWYDELQATRAERLERVAASRADTFVVVSPDDADRMSLRLGRPVEALPNGGTFSGRASAAPSLARRKTIAFVGTLDYPPNVAAVRTLCRDVMPVVRDRVSDVHVVIAGRRPPPEILALQSHHVEVRAEVADVWSVMAEAAVLAFLGDVGQGKKNTVTEALSVGRPVVASSNSARGQARGTHLVVADTTHDQARALELFLTDDVAWEAACTSAADAATTVLHWDETSRRFDMLLRSASS